MSAPPTIVHHIHIHTDPLVWDVHYTAYMLSIKPRQVYKLVDAGLLQGVKSPTINGKGEEVPGDLRICVKSVRAYKAKGEIENINSKALKVVGRLK